MPTPHINSLSPVSGPVGTHVLISGSNLSLGASGTVSFNGITAVLLSATSTNIVAIVPGGASSGDVVVVNASDQRSNGVFFTVTGASGPHISSINPSSGGTGINVTITGTNFGPTQSTSTATFNGVLASIISWSTTSIVAVVPATATTGPVVVTTSAGVSNGVTYTVTNPSNGGTPGPLNLLLIPAENFTTAVIWAFDPTNFNDASFGSNYSWKVEDVIAGRQATFNRLIISYRDLGVATLTVTITGTNDSAEIVTFTEDITIGTVAASGKICSQVVGVNHTATNLQLSVERLANGGPVSITKIRMEGRVEMTVY